MRSALFIRSTRLALITSAAAALAIMTTACDSGASDAAGSPKAVTTAPSAGTGGGGAAAGGDVTKEDAASDSSGKNASGTEGSGAKDGGIGQVCGANDLTLDTKKETQAGGFILLSVKANPGITCTLPAALPTIAFGSGGIEAGPAEQAVGAAVTLSGSSAVYAGVNPKTTNTDYGTEFTEMIFAVGNEDPNPVGLPVGKVLVDKPVVTNWHTSAAEVGPLLAG